MSNSDTWSISNTRHDAHALGQHNSVFTISNGYLGLKGNVSEDLDGYSPVTLINGVYDELDMFSLLRSAGEERRYLDPRYYDKAGRSPAVANLPSPLLTRIFVGDHQISLTRGEVSNFRQTLDMSCGLYRYQFDYRDADGRSTRVESLRFASLAHAHRVFARVSVTALDHTAPIRVDSGVSGGVCSNTTRERQFQVVDLSAHPRTRTTMHVRTPARGHDVFAGAISVCKNTTRVVEKRGVVEHDCAVTRIDLAPLQGEPIAISRYVVLASSEDARHGVAVDFEAELTSAQEQGFTAALAEQKAQWRKLWERSDVEIDGDDAAQRYLRFCLYHLLAAAPRFADRLSVPVKLLSGEYYQGNTFYDTDVYIAPFYTFTQPHFARACLNFRHAGLAPGRQIAQRLWERYTTGDLADGGAIDSRAPGANDRQPALPSLAQAAAALPAGESPPAPPLGAKLAWQAGPNGEECLGDWWRFTHTNIHINGDAAHALMQYLLASGDERYLRERGIDLLVESARFYAWRAHHDAAADAYHLRDVSGPDEGHCESVDNFYTNLLAARTLAWAADALERMERTDATAWRAAVERLSIARDEPARWRRVGERLRFLFDPRTKIYEQCKGFHQLKAVPEDLLAGRKVWFVTVFPYQALNQPDVVMGMVLFRDDFPAEVVSANWRHYKLLSMNFSSMSFVLNSIMGAEQGELDYAYEQFLMSAGADVDESLTGRRDTHAGLHGTAMGGAWMAAVFGFGGVNLSPAGLRINPRLPAGWSALRFTLLLRGVPLRVQVERGALTLCAEGEPHVEMSLTVAGRAVTLRGGQAQRVDLSTP